MSSPGAPTMAIPLEIATLHPKWSPAAPSDARSVNRSLPVTASKTYAAPAASPMSSSSHAPTTTVSSDALTD